MSKTFNKGVIYSLIALTFSITVLFSCSKSEKNSVNNVRTDLVSIPFTDKQSFELLQSFDVQRIITLQNQFLDKINILIKNGVQIDLLKNTLSEAVNTGDESTFLKLIFGSVSKGNAFIAELKSRRQNLLNTYPVFLKNKDQITCIDCQKINTLQIDKFFVNFNYYNTNRLTPIPSTAVYAAPRTVTVANATPDTPTCGSYWQQAKLVICAGLCSASTVGVGTALCGWACWCMLCPTNSELSKLIC